LEQTGTYRTLVRAAGKNSREFLRGPTVTLPYSPEFAPRQGLPSGRELLDDIAKLSKGRERTDILSVLADPPRSMQTRSLLPWLFAMSLAVLLLEIAGRRLSWWETFPWWRRSAVAAELTSDIPRAAEAKPSWWKSFVPKRTRRRTVVTPIPTTAASSTPKVTTSTVPPKVTTTPKTTVSAADLFDQAKRRASNRLK
jgi:hypothetical protein